MKAKIICLIFLVGLFAIKPVFCFGFAWPAGIENSQQLQLKEEYSKKILQSLNQQFFDKKVDLITSSDSRPVDQAVLIIAKRAVFEDLFNFLTVQAPEEAVRSMIDAVILIVRDIQGGGIGTVINELEAMSISEAEKYLTEQMLSAGMKMSTGNLDFSYKDFNEVWHKKSFPCVIVYKPINGDEKGEAAIRVYSAEALTPPIVNYISQWEGGIDQVPPFILEITGTVEKEPWGTFDWPEGSTIKFIYDEKIPDLNFPKQNFLASWKNELLQIGTIISNALGNSKSLKAGIAPNSGLLDAGNLKNIDISQLGQGENLSENEPIEDLSKSAGTFAPTPTPSPSQTPSAPSSLPSAPVQNLTLEEIAEQINEISKQVSSLEQEYVLIFGPSEGSSSGQNENKKIEPTDSADASGSNNTNNTNINTNTANLASSTNLTNSNNSNNSTTDIFANDEEDSGDSADSTDNGSGSADNPIVYPKILINETQAAGEKDVKDEFVELYNPNNSDIDLTGWYLQRKTVGAKDYSSYAPADLFFGKTLKAGQYFLIARQDSAFSGSADVLTDYPLSKDNSLVLKNPNKKIADKLGFGSASDFETEPAQNPDSGFSIGRQKDSQTGIYIDTDNNFQDFKEMVATPKAENAAPGIPGIQNTSAPTPTPAPENDNQEVDTTPPEVAFDVLEIQKSLNFSIGFEIQDEAVGSQSPSGLDGFVFQWKEENGDWAEDNYQKIEGGPDIFQSQRNFTGEDGKTYYFQIKAKDLAGNESAFAPNPAAFTKISLPALPILIDEIQIDSLAGKGGANNDWVLLYNPNNSDISLNGWSLQKHSSDDPCSLAKSFYKKDFPKDAIIAGQGFFLVASSNSDSQLKDKADMTIGWSLSDNNTIYLINSKNTLSDPNSDSVVDKVGFGEKACFSETSPAENPLEGGSIKRKQLGLDTNDNSQDFEIINQPIVKNSKGEIVYFKAFSEDPWPYFRYDAKDTGNSPFSFANSGSDLPKNKILVQGENFGDFLIDDFGVVYIPGTYQGKTGVNAFYPDGSLKWTYETPLPLGQMALISDGKIVFVSSQNNSLIILDNNGNLVLEKSFLKIDQNSGLVIDGNGIIYFLATAVQENGLKLVAFDPAKNEVSWTFGKDEEKISGSHSPVLSKDAIYFSFGNTLYALNFDGTEKWRHNFSSSYSWYQGVPFLTGLSIGNNGEIFALVSAESDWSSVSNEGINSCFHILSSENKELATSNCNVDQNYSDTDLAVSPKNNVYFDRHFFYWSAPVDFISKISSSSGKDLAGWSFPGVPGDGNYMAWLVDSEENIYLLKQGKIKVLNSSGQEKWSLDVGGSDSVNSLALMGDNKLIYSTGNTIGIIEP